MTLTDRDPHDPQVPDGVAGALRRLAAHVPEADLHPATPRQRLRARRRRRTLMGSGVAAMLLAGVVMVNRTTGGRR